MIWLLLLAWGCGGCEVEGLAPGCGAEIDGQVIRLGDTQKAVERRLGAPDRAHDLGSWGTMLDWDGAGASVLVQEEEVDAIYLSQVPSSAIGKKQVKSKEGTIVSLSAVIGAF